LTTVLAIENIQNINGSGKVTAEFRYYPSSSELPPAQLATAIRSHWAIENRLHRAAVPARLEVGRDSPLPSAGD
jgi:predicted transposase YbfD/YdcC